MLAERFKRWEKEFVERGREQGLNEGESTLLKQLLEQRFGPLPNWALEKLDTADRRHLEHWGLQLLEATTLDAIFSEPVD